MKDIIFFLIILMSFPSNTIDGCKMMELIPKSPSVSTNSIGSLVFYDANEDGIWAGTIEERGIPNVRVELYRDDNGDSDPETLVDFTDTDLSGTYFFSGLSDGLYRVVIPDRPNITARISAVSDPSDENEEIQNGIPFNDGFASTPFFLEAGNEPVENSFFGGDDQDDFSDANGNMTIDFGFVPIVRTTIIRCFRANPSSRSPTSFFSRGIEGLEVNFYQDLDYDGILDVVELSTRTHTTITDQNGNADYEFIVDGPFAVEVVPLDGLLAPELYFFNYSSGNLDGDYGFIPKLNNVITVDFGLVPINSIGSNVFYDLNNNGEQDEANSSEIGISGVSVNLYTDLDEDGEFSEAEMSSSLLSTITDSRGDYYFENLPEAYYRVGVVPKQVAAVSSGSSQPSVGERDGINNGTQAGGEGAESLTEPFNLIAGIQPIGDEEERSGGMQDDTYDEYGNMAIDFGFLATPVNVDCADALPMFEPDGSMSANNDRLYVTSSDFSSLELPYCNQGENAVFGDMWFSLDGATPGSELSIIADGTISGTDATIELYSGDCNDLTLLDCADVTGALEELNYTIPFLVARNSTSGVAEENLLVRVFIAGSDGGAFTVTVTESALPLNLTKFSGKAEAKYNLLEWATDYEASVQQFLVERTETATDDWENIGKLAAAGHSTEWLNYHFQDINPGKQAFYRLRIEDLDGSFKYGPVISLSRSENFTDELNIYPQPAKDLLAGTFNVEQPNKATVSVFDLTGRAMHHSTFFSQKGQNEFAINISSLPIGFYSLVITLPERKMTKIVVVVR